MLKVVTSEESGCAKLLGLTGNPKSEGGLICHTTSLLATPEGEGYDSCSFYSGPSDATIFAFGESGESCGSIASSSGGSFSCGGGCNYAC